MRKNILLVTGMMTTLLFLISSFTPGIVVAFQNNNDTQSVHIIKVGIYVAPH